DPSMIVSRHRSEVPYLFGEAADLRTIENTTIETMERELKNECHFTWALDLALISLDAELEDDIRIDAFEDLEELIKENAILERLENVLYSHPPPEDADLTGALQLCDRETQPAVFAFLQRLENHQPASTAVYQAWEAIPTNTFGTQGDQKTFKHIAVREGLFRTLVTLDSLTAISGFLLKAGLNESIRRLPNYRKVLQTWAAPFRQ